MRVAIPDWHGKVSPVFDVAGRLLVIDLERGEEIRRRAEVLTGLTPVARVHRLGALGVDTLVCGAISSAVEHLAVAIGIRVVSLVSGPVDAVARIIAAGQPIPASCLLPGCERPRVRRGARN